MIDQDRISARLRFGAGTLPALSVAVALSLATATYAEDRRSPPFGAEGAGWREGVQCGPNALYAFLKLSGWKGTLKDVREAVPVQDEKGCSLATLYYASNRLGVPTKLIQTDVDGLRKGGLPALVHMDNPEYMQAGHFGLVMGVGQSRMTAQKVLYMLDPIVISSYERSAAQFERYWSGYALVRREPRGAEVVNLLLMGLVGCNVLCAVRLLVRRGPG